MEKNFNVSISVLKKFFQKNEKELRTPSNEHLEILYSKVFTHHSYDLLLSIINDEILALYVYNINVNNFMLLQNVKFKDQHIAIRKALLIHNKSLEVTIKTKLIKYESQKYNFTHFLSSAEQFIINHKVDKEEVLKEIVKRAQTLNLEQILKLSLKSKNLVNELVQYILDYSQGNYPLNTTKTLSNIFDSVTYEKNIILKCKICSKNLEIKNGNKKSIIDKQSKYKYNVNCNHNNGSQEIMMIDLTKHKNIISNLSVVGYIDFIIYNYNLLVNINDK